MSQDDEQWGPWIEHDGKGIPPSVVGKLISVVGLTAGTMREVEQTSIINPWQVDWDGYKAWDWSYYGEVSPENDWLYGKILRYRVKRPRALQQLIDLAESVPANSEGVPA